MHFRKRDISEGQARDTGMALALVFLLLFAGFRRNMFLSAAIAVHVVNMVWPGAFRPFAVVWLGASEILGWFMSRLILSIVFFVIVTPIGVLRRMMGYDALKLREFKGSTASVLVIRNHKYRPVDIERPY